MINLLQNKRTSTKWLAILLATIFLSIFLITISVLAYQANHQNKIYRGVKVGNLYLGGLTKTQATDLLYQITTDIEKQGLQIAYQNNDKLNLNLTSTLSALNDPDLSRDVLTFNNHETVDQAFNLGRSQAWYKNLTKQLTIFFQTETIEAQYDLDEDLLNQQLELQFSKLEKNAKNARPKITFNNSDYQIDILPAEAGVTINYRQAVQQIKNNLNNLRNSVITIEKIVEAAPVTEAEVVGHKNLIEKLLATSTPQLTYDNRNWNIEKQQLSDMLEFQKSTDNKIVVGLNYQQWINWSENNLTPIINKEPRNASLKLNNGKVVNFTPHRDGQKVNIQSTYQQVNQALNSNNLNVQIVVDIVEPQTAIGDINDMGVKELIGTGRSDFAGSPANRRHNIKVGADSLHGILIAPNEEFSLVKALGDIDAAAGYLPELVIKGNRTIPEYGGGLCQIATTAFRVALDTGLPITERRPHAYSVSYYLENGLPGVDATIYVPRPDVRFVNDSENYILFQARIEGDEVVFEFWGTKDDRQVERTEVKAWDWVSPPPTKYIETLDLPPGQKKCTESSHRGVKTSFDYKVTYANGDVKEQTFFSQYRPWQAVCLIGVEKLSTEEDNNDDDTQDETPSTI